MITSLKNIIRKISVAFFCAMFILPALPEDAFASGSYWLSSTSLTVTQGSSTTFSFGATNAVGAFTISTGGGVSASCSSETWVDNSSVTITVEGNTVGTGYVYISVYDGADYDGNDLSGKSYTVTVTVKSASGGTLSETTTASKTEATTKATTKATTTTQATTTTEETTTVDPEIELLTVTVDDVSMLVSKEISEDDIIDGFSVEETVYNTVSVQALVYEDVVIYILEDEEGSTGYYTLDSSGSFEPLRYTTLSEKMCIFLDMPENLDIPYGYSLVETEIYGFTVEALVVDEEEEEDVSSESGLSEDESSEEGDESDEESSQAKVKEYFTVGASGADEEEDTLSEDSEETDVSDEDTEESEAEEELSDDVTTIDNMVASAQGHYYVYCLLEGEKMLCDYDSEDDILQRCTALLEIEEETVEVIAVDEDIEEEEAIDMEKLLFIEVVIACGIIVALIIVLIIVLAVKHKNKKDPDYVDDIDFDEEELFEKEEPVYIPDSVQRRADIRKLKEQSDLQAEQSAPSDEAVKSETGSGGDADKAGPDPDVLPDENTKEAASEENPASGASCGSSEDFLLNVDSFFDDEIKQNPGSEEPAAENIPEPEPEPEDISVDMEIEDITEILSDEFSDILKYVGDEEK